MNGGIIGKPSTNSKGVWTPNDMINSYSIPLLVRVPSDATIITALTSASGRSVSNGSHGTNATNWKYGNSALNVWKTSTSQPYVESYVDGLTALDLTNKLVGLLMYIKDAATLAKLVDIRFTLGQGQTSRRYFKFLPAALKVGWQRLEKAINSPDSSEGAAGVTGVDYNTVGIVVTANNVVTAEGDVVFNGLYYRG